MNNENKLAASGKSWSWSSTMVGRGLSQLFWASVCAFFAALGSCSVRAEGRKGVLDLRRLLTHSGIAAAVTAAGLSAIGLGIGNIARFMALLEDGWFKLFLGGFGVTFVMTAGLWIRARRESRPDHCRRRFPCPHCKAGMDARWIAPGLAPALLRLRRCRSCGGLATRRGEPAACVVPAFGALAVPWLGAAAASAGSALAGLVAAGFFWNAVGARCLAEAREQVRGAGFPAELPRERPMPKNREDNAVYWYEKAGKALEGRKSDYNFYKNKIDGKTKSEDDFARMFIEHAALGTISADEAVAARKLAAAHRDALALLGTGASKKEENWGINWDYRPTFAINVPRYAYLTRLTKVLACRAALAAKDGRTDAAVQDLILGLKLARSVGSEPMLISRMIEAAMARSLLDAAVPVLAKLPPNRAEKEVAPLLSADRLVKGFLESLALEHYGMAGWYGEMSFLKTVRANAESGGAIDVWLWVYWPFLKLDVASHFRSSLDFDRALSEPFPKSKVEYEKAERLFKRRSWMLSQIAMPRFEQLHERTLVQQAQQRLALTSLAVRAFKNKTGRWPDALWEVGAAADSGHSRQDPFTGGPFKLLRRQGGAVLYSVGPDGVDDQGAPYDGGLMKGDIVWRL